MCVTSVKNYNDCMIRTVETIARTSYRLKFSDLPKLVQKIVEDEAAAMCSHDLTDYSSHVWRGKIH